MSLKDVMTCEKYCVFDARAGWISALTCARPSSAISGEAPPEIIPDLRTNTIKLKT